MSNNTLDTQQLIDELNELLETKQFTKLHEVIADTNEMDVAEFMEQLTPLQQITCFRTLPKGQASCHYRSGVGAHHRGSVCG